MAVTLPLLLLLIDYFVKRQFNWKSIIEKIPFFILSLVFGLVALYSQKNAGAVNHDIVDTNIIQRFFMFTYSISFYIFKLIIPIKLAALHSFPKALTLEYYLSPLFLLAIVFLIFKAKELKKVIIFALLFYLISISVVLMIVPVGHALVSERYTYIPYLGFFFLGAYYFTNLTTKTQRTLRNTKVYLYGIFIIYVIVFTALSVSRAGVWRDNISFYDDILSKYPEDSFAYINRGSAKDDINDLTGAMSDYNTGIKLNPKDEVAFSDRGMLKQKLKDFTGALEDYSRSVELNSKFYYGYYNRSVVRLELKDFKGTLEDCDKAIGLKPDFGVAYLNRAAARKGLKDYAGAISDYNTLLGFKPDMYEAYYNRGNAKLETQDFAGAVKDYSKTLTLRPDIGSAYLNRAMAYLNLKDTLSACADWNNARVAGYNVEEMTIKYCK